jgi:electron transfer flavoprotein beta subunit
MKILVCSHVPDTTSKINFTNGDSEFDTNGVQYVINPNDEFGLTRAIWFQENKSNSNRCKCWRTRNRTYFKKN